MPRDPLLQGSMRVRVSKRFFDLPLSGHLWMIWRYGIRRWARYERARRIGITIDYAEIFTPDELARLGEHSVPAPWEQP